MLPLIKVIEPGFLTTIQDAGRKGFRKFGVPFGGALDDFSFRLANILVGNPEEEATLEITWRGPKLRFLKDCVVALTGGEAEVSLDKRQLPCQSRFEIKKGSLLSIGEIKKGLRIYLAVRGGIYARAVMGSVSTYLPGKFGGIDGRALCAGDTISSIAVKGEDFSFTKPIRLLPDFNPMPEEEIIIRVAKGPQFTWFTKKSIMAFSENFYVLSAQSDRTGLRLDGSSLDLIKMKPMVSEGTVPGSIQVPTGGIPLVLMADAHTIGGYPQIAVVIKPDMDKLAQLRPGAKIQFKFVSPEIVLEAWKEKRRKLEEAKDIVHGTDLMNRARCSLEELLEFTRGADCEELFMESDGVKIRIEKKR